MVKSFKKPIQGLPNVAPVARIATPVADAADPLTIQFNASGSTDDAGQSQLSYAWRFGDNTTSTAAKLGCRA